MTEQGRTGQDPAEVEPTDNSTGEAVDAERVEEVEDEVREQE